MVNLVLDFAGLNTYLPWFMDIHGYYIQVSGAILHS